MEPLNDNDLNQMLRKWEAPGAPAGMRVATNRATQSRWSWLWSGRIHVPVPVGAGMILAAVAFAVYSGKAVPTPASPAAGNAVVSPADPPVSPNPPVAPAPEHTSPPVIKDDKAVTAALSGFQPVRQLELKIVRVQP